MSVHHQIQNVLQEQVLGASCKDITTHLCGKEPSRCREALNIMYNFIIGSERNKI